MTWLSVQHGGVPRGIYLGALANIVGGIVAGIGFALSGNWPALLWVLISFMWCASGLLAWRTTHLLREVDHG